MTEQAKEQTPFERFKDAEFKGDKLLTLVVSDILLQKGVQRTDVLGICAKYTSNKHLATVFDALELKPHPDDSPPLIHWQPFKQKGNTVEHHFWRFFKKNGYAKTVNLFRPFVTWPNVIP